MTASAASTPAAAARLVTSDHLGEAVADRAERRARVEAEPAEPEDEHAEADERHRVPGDRPRLAVGAVLAPARAEQQQRREAAGGADQVDHGRAGEVLHADVHLEPAAAEDPVAQHRVDQRREDHGVDHVGAELDPLERGAPDDRQGDRAEDELEEQQRRRADADDAQQREVAAASAGGVPDVEEKPLVPAIVPAPPKASAKPDGPVGDRGRSSSWSGSSRPRGRRSSRARSRPRGTGTRPA